MVARFVVIEGLDGAGTTTQVARLVGRLVAGGFAVERTNEPTGRAVGRLVRSVLQGGETAPERAALPWLFAADRADHLAHTVGPALAGGRHVVSDRYVPSSLAYQALDVEMDLVWALNASFPAPDLTVFVDVPIELCLARIGARGAAREIFEQRELLERVAAHYELALGRLQARGDRIARVDGTKDIDTVGNAIAALVLPLIEG